ncbi:MAG TPA: hypothetical protein ENI23_16300, partial [bacterium]|nr:hypothetical protein [bacterium]
PRCMGGKLKSNLIICKKCNNNFGTEFDQALIERFALILHPVRLFNPHLSIRAFIKANNFISSIIIIRKFVIN